jgi:hypothetical protein
MDWSKMRLEEDIRKDLAKQFHAMAAQFEDWRNGKCPRSKTSRPMPSLLREITLVAPITKPSA